MNAHSVSSFQTQKCMLYALVFLCLIFLYGNVFAQQTVSKPDWFALRFLLGEWVGEGSGEPGQGNSSYTFAFDLDEQILVRRNHTEYLSTKDRPGFFHDDLMVVYPIHNESMRAIYFDNEGHVINYKVELSQDGNTATFVSDPLPTTPRFRLTYVKQAVDLVLIRFETAPPSQPNKFSQYLEGKAHRTKSFPAIKSKESPK